MHSSISYLKVSENKRFLMHEDGSPFFWLGDTAWELFHKLNREDAELYLTNRAERKFTVIQAVALAELEGVTTDNAHGRRPLKANTSGQYDPSLPDVSEDADDYDYWKHVDYIVDKAASLGLYIAFLPTWGDKYNKHWGKGPEIFNPENAKAYGKWLGERYKDKANLIWVLGGDRPLGMRKHFEIVHAMAEGLKVGDEGRHLITFHPVGGQSSSYHVHEEDWLDFNMIQSGHGYYERNNYNHVAADYGRLPTKPVLDAEPCYEDHPRGFKATNGYFDETDVRVAAYYAVFAGAFGHTYGHHSIWSMTTEPADYFIMHWKDAIMRPGASQMQYLKSLIESRPFFDRVPDQSLLAENYEEANHMQATRGKDYAFIYTPNGLKMDVNLGKISGATVDASWFNPRTGETASIGQFENSGVRTFTPPISGRGNDWVLVLDDDDKK
jgi:hypothetical protein